MLIQCYRVWKYGALRHMAWKWHTMEITWHGNGICILNCVEILYGIYYSIIIVIIIITITGYYNLMYNYYLLFTCNVQLYYKYISFSMVEKYIGNVLWKKHASKSLFNSNGKQSVSFLYISKSGVKYVCWLVSVIMLVCV